MGRRVFIGQDSGVMKFRVSRLSSVDAKTAAIANLSIYETMSPMVPKESGTIVFGGSGTITVNLQRSYNYPPFFLLKTSDNTCPGWPNLWATARIDNGQFDVHSEQARTVRWYAFDELDAVLS
ncbi:hypothetical protein EVB39_035 [Rhizobium phage RHph_TM3_3_9]|nr:hypothetical protein EVB39_035 [Rhizobium phage RHph_TM3_3_9]QIG68556.1 hypothetical protein EVB66_035 [Rhizobium phage RHph_TM3_3_13]QIG74414.1 hypothetical protein EVC09_034 [Rhizobium phage RHph_TM3_3_10]QXV74528.1 hypothetical protein [Rhizobium phage RHEph19]